MTEPLVGKALLKKVKTINKTSPDVARRELASLCGYVKKTKKGGERVNVAGFYEALLEARGLDLGSDTESKRRGREMSYRISVQKNGQLLVGGAYTKSMGLEPGDEFDVKLGYKHIHLVKRGEDGEEAE